MPVTVTTRVEDTLAEAIDEIADTESMDRSTVIRRFLSKAVKEWLIEKGLREYDEGKITLWQAAKRCNLPLWEMIEKVRLHHSRVPYGLDDLKEDLKGLAID
jgi:predicted transcriptional regulator